MSTRLHIALRLAARYIANGQATLAQQQLRDALGLTNLPGQQQFRPHVMRALNYARCI